MVRMVAAAFDLPDDSNKAVLLSRVEKFLLACHRQGKRALLVVDEAQNLPARSVEELRMLSNFVSAERPLLQIFLLGQPEFRKILRSPGMEQLSQRVIASYHLGPMDGPIFDQSQVHLRCRRLLQGRQIGPFYFKGCFGLVMGELFPGFNGI